MAIAVVRGGFVVGALWLSSYLAPFRDVVLCRTRPAMPLEH